MKISLIIDLLTLAKKEYGDLEVGIRDAEFWNFSPIGKLEKRVPNMESRAWNDDPSLGQVFIGIDFE